MAASQKDLYAKLVGIVCASDQEAIAFCTMELADMGYYVVTDKENYVFGVPETELITPVMLMAHIDTCRKSDDVVPRLFRDTMYNGNAKACGCLGADDRAGVFIALEIAERLEHKPYVLFTTGEETGHHGVTAFLNANHPERSTHVETFWAGKKIIAPYLDDINCVLQYDRQGYNSVVAYGMSKLEYDLIRKAEVLGYHLDNGSTSDSRNFSEATLIAHLNLSAGFVNQHSEDELLLLPALDFAVRNGVFLAQVIDRPFRVTKTPTYTYTPGRKYSAYPAKSGEDYNARFGVKKTIRPVCDVCDKFRPTSYHIGIQANLCKKCERRLEEDVRKYPLSTISVSILRSALSADRALSKKNNLPFVPTCPVGGNDHEDVFPCQDGVCFCDDCGTWFLATKTGVYWWDTPNSKEAYFRFHDNPVSIYTVSTTDENCPLDNCMICGELMHDRSLSYYDNKETGDYTLVVCDKCNAIDPPTRRNNAGYQEDY